MSRLNAESPLLSESDEEVTDISEEVMARAREEVALEFLKACGADKEKRKVVEALAKIVLGRQLDTSTVDDSSTASDDTDGNQDDADSFLNKMEEIIELPYEEDKNAEVGEKPFDDFKSLLLPKVSKATSSRRRTSSLDPKAKAIKVFGKEIAQTAVNAYQQIHTSGLIYSPAWLTGVIRDIKCGPINKKMLLMCLQEQRFARADVATLGKIIDDIEVSKLVLRAADEWGFQPLKILSFDPSQLPFEYNRKNQRMCQQCEIFVARSYIAFQLLGIRTIDDDLAEKISSCMEKMVDNMTKSYTARVEASASEFSYGSDSAVSNFSDVSSNDNHDVDDSSVSDVLEDDASQGDQISKGKKAKQEGTFEVASKRKSLSKEQKKRKRNVRARTRENIEIDEEDKEEEREGKPSAKDQRKKRKGNNRGKDSNSKAIKSLASAEKAKAFPGQNTNVSEIGSASLRAIASIEEIYESPYTENGSAEVGEELFDTFKSLLEPQQGFGRRAVTASKATIDKFGATLANSLVRASSNIATSGMTYSAEWREGKIREASLGFIPKPFLLLCLQEQRIGRSDDSVLTKIVNDLGVLDNFNQAIQEWKLGDDFPILVPLSSIQIFRHSKHLILKCLIFVARAFRCMICLKRKSIDRSVMDKVKACLSIIESHIPTPQATRARTPASLPTPQIEVEESSDSDYTEEAETGAIEHKLLHGNASSQKEVTVSQKVLSRPVAKMNYSVPHILTTNPHEPRQQGTGPAPERARTLKAPPKIPERGAPLDRSNQPLPSRFDQPKSTTILTKAKEIKLPTLHDDGTEWFPYDESEAILNKIEVELAWLIEESMYSLRSGREIQWDFVYKYASPPLQIELRKVANDGKQLQKLVRLSDGLVVKRFEVVKKNVRIKLIGGKYRPKISNIMATLRRASRPMLGSIRKA